MRFSESVLQTFMHSEMADFVIGIRAVRAAAAANRCGFSDGGKEKGRPGTGSHKKAATEDVSAHTAAVAIASARCPWSAAAPAYARETIDVDTTGARVSRCRDAIRAEHNQHASRMV